MHASSSAQHPTYMRTEEKSESFFPMSIRCECSALSLTHIFRVFHSHQQLVKSPVGSEMSEDCDCHEIAEEAQAAQGRQSHTLSPEVHGLNQVLVLGLKLVALISVPAETRNVLMRISDSVCMVKCSSNINVCKHNFNRARLAQLFILKRRMNVRTAGQVTLYARFRVLQLEGVGDTRGRGFGVLVVVGGSAPRVSSRPREL